MTHINYSQGDYEQAIRLYLKGGLPAQAGRVLKERTVENQGQLLETVASTLSAAGMHDKAGEFYEEMNQLQRAMDRCVFGVCTAMKNDTEEEANRLSPGV